MSRAARIGLLALIAVAAFALGGWLSLLRTGQDGTPADMHSYVLDPPRPLPEFTMTDQDGEPFSARDFEGDWSFLYFGYSYCPDVCPMALAEMARVKRRLEGEGIDPGRYYLVSVDPRRDTPERLAEYVAYFDPDFRGLTGDTPAIDVVTRAAGVVYQVPEAPEDDDYLVGHSSTITLVDPDGRIHAIFTTPLVAEDIAREFGSISEP